MKLYELIELASDKIDDLENQLESLDIQYTSYDDGEHYFYYYQSDEENGCETLYDLVCVYPELDKILTDKLNSII
jgi:hypothetical protein